jgi:L-alanine-DL-glutamate epimerase-like enolase superfamily enzyme
LHAANAVCLFSTSIHFAASVPNCDSVENHQVHRWLSDYAPVATMALQEGPHVSPLESPGHGMDFLTPELIDRISKEIAEASFQ